MPDVAGWSGKATDIAPRFRDPTFVNDRGAGDEHAESVRADGVEID